VGQPAHGLDQQVPLSAVARSGTGPSTSGRAWACRHRSRSRFRAIWLR
jgi:hypothetical protein